MVRHRAVDGGSRRTAAGHIREHISAKTHTIVGSERVLDELVSWVSWRPAESYTWVGGRVLMRRISEHLGRLIQTHSAGQNTYMK